MLNKKILFPIMAAAMVTSSIIFGILRTHFQNGNFLSSGLANIVVQKLGF